jgi:hypothetical protein
MSVDRRSFGETKRRTGVSGVFLEQTETPLSAAQSFRIKATDAPSSAYAGKL